MPTTHPIRPALFRFHKDLAANNTREWFQANKGRYEDEVRGPALELIGAIGPHLAKVSEHILADPRPVGGSLFRLHRDVRFSKDKSPYKDHTGIHFRHEAGKSAHAPGYYLHLQPGLVFVGLGIWHPDTATQRKIRQAILDDPAGWKKATRGKRFTDTWRLDGESLKRPPQGVDKDHPLIEDLKRKDFCATVDLKQKDVTTAGFEKRFGDFAKRGAPMMKFLCDALGMPF